MIKASYSLALSEFPRAKSNAESRNHTIMPPGRKLGGGCWTCRLRRKRCDSIRPVCGVCKDLEITCYSNDARPSWMDGGTRQKHMSELTKQAIKQNAFVRRERRLVDRGNHGAVIAMDTNHDSHADDASGLDTDAANRLVTDTASHSDSVKTPTLWSPTDQPEELKTSSSSIPATSCPVTLPLNASPGGLVLPIQVQLGSVMIYLDYVFPFLFPFYQPSLIETGRQWLLGLLCQNEASFHIAAGLSAYFFTLVPQNDGQDMHDDCKALVWDQLVEQMDLAIKSIQSTVSAISQSVVQCPVLNKVRIMEEITQLLIVETTVRRDIDWTIHLTPALVTFNEIFQSYGLDHLNPSLTVLLASLPSQSMMPMSHHKPLPNTADQSALVFFVSVLLFVDIIASTSLGKPPVLQNYHSSLLSSFSVCLEAVLGCQNWAHVAIGNISALCAWKQEAKENGNFSVVQLVNLGASISQEIDKGLTNLNINAAHPHSSRPNTSRLESYYSRHDKAIDSTSIANITRIWAYAAKIYLYVSLSGWQPRATEVQASVTRILCLLQTIESPAQLRSLSWPICVAGCLALPTQELDFCRVIEITMGSLIEFGTVFNALRIMKSVWRSRDTVARNASDVASLLSILGSPALLI